MMKFGSCFSASLVTCCVLAVASAKAETVVVPFESALPMNDTCDPVDALGWHPRHDGDTCIVRFPIVVPVGKKIEQITVLHGTTDYAAASEIDASLTVYPATTPWQQALDEFPFHDATVHGAFDVQATPLMHQTGKIFPDAFAMQGSTVYCVSVRLAYDAFVAGLQLTYD
jgi:hypothetical protein